MAWYFTRDRPRLVRSPHGGQTGFGSLCGPRREPTGWNRARGACRTSACGHSWSWRPSWNVFVLGSRGISESGVRKGKRRPKEEIPRAKLKWNRRNPQVCTIFEWHFPLESLCFERAGGRGSYCPRPAGNMAQASAALWGRVTDRARTPSPTSSGWKTIAWPCSRRRPGRAARRSVPQQQVRRARGPAPLPSAVVQPPAHGPATLLSATGRKSHTQRAVELRRKAHLGGIKR